MNPNHLFTRPPGVYEQCLVPVASIVPGRWQPRRNFDEQRLSELADSIREFGILTRLKVFYNENDQYELIAGERRWRAAQLAGLSIVPCEIVEWTASQIQEVSIIDNLQRDDLTPEDEGAAFEMAIQQLGVSEADLARRMSKGRTYIQQRRKLAAAAPELRKAFANGTLTFSIVRGILAGAGDNHCFQLLGLKETLEAIKVHGQIKETQAAHKTRLAAINASEDDLIALGWRLSSIWWDSKKRTYVRFVYSKDKRPSVWSGAKISRILNGQEPPKSEFLPSEMVKIEISKQKWHATRLLGTSIYDNVCLPFYRVAHNDTVEWMTGSELKMFAYELELEIEQRREAFAEYGIKLVLNSRDFSLHTAVGPTKYSALEWAKTGELLLQLSAGEIEIKARYPKELGRVHNPIDPTPADPVAERLRPKCECGKPHDIKSDFSFHRGVHKKYCRDCLNSFKKENKEAKRAIINEITPLLENATEQQRHMMSLLLGNATSILYEQDDVEKIALTWAAEIWSESGRINREERRDIIRKVLEL